MATPEAIRNFFNAQLSRYGQKPWEEGSKKWVIAKSKLKIGIVMWQKGQFHFLNITLM